MKNLTPTLRLNLLLAMLWACASCSVALVDRNQGPQPDLVADDLQLRILPDTFIDSGSFDTLSLSRVSADEYQVSVQGARSLKALYFEIRFDHSQRSYLRTLPTEFWGPEADYLTLSIPGHPGYAEFGLVMIHPDEKSGVSGSGVLATISFN